MVRISNRYVNAVRLLGKWTQKTLSRQGNTIQLGLAIARVFGKSHDSTFHMPDRQALASLASFLAGAFVGRIGDRMGLKKRLWLVVATLLQAALTLAACLTARSAHQVASVADSRGDPLWTNTLGFATLMFASASMGLQARVGSGLGSLFATCV